uniref:Uncharacterized protein n=1 Tax=Ananas comosus var. bracteatus TaxID=296719 RepID=A0A6V7QVP1_ANACO
MASFQKQASEELIASLYDEGVLSTKKVKKSSPKFFSMRVLLLLLSSAGGLGSTVSKLYDKSDAVGDGSSSSSSSSPWFGAKFEVNERVGEVGSAIRRAVAVRVVAREIGPNGCRVPREADCKCRQAIGMRNECLLGPVGRALPLGGRTHWELYLYSSHPRIVFGGTGSHVSGTAARGEGVVP